MNYKDNGTSIVIGIILVLVMIIVLAMNPVTIHGILPNNVPITVHSLSEEGAEIKLQHELNKSGYDYYIKVIYE